MSPADLIGQTFGRLKVLRRGPNLGSSPRFFCLCACGEIALIHGSSLRWGATTSCGCYHREVQSNLTRHGKARHVGRAPEYVSWANAKTRCFNQGAAVFKNYGGRGVTMCDEWRDDFAAFLRDMGPRPDGTTLDRIDGDGNYEPGNCRWATQAEQSRNRRNNRMVTIGGETLCLHDWIVRLDLNITTVYYRLGAGWSVEDALTMPVARSGPDRPSA